MSNDHHFEAFDKSVLGSGTTLGEGMKLGAKGIGRDINPRPTIIVQETGTHPGRGGDLYQMAGSGR